MTEAQRINVHYRDCKRDGFPKTIRFLDECVLVGGPGTLLLKRAAIV